MVYFDIDTILALMTAAGSQWLDTLFKGFKTYMETGEELQTRDGMVNAAFFLGKKIIDLQSEQE